MTQPQAEMLDLYRAGLKTAADLLKTSLENAERLQNQQLVAIRTAIVEQSKSASELGAARTIDELLTAQSRLAEALDNNVGLLACENTMTNTKVSRNDMYGGIAYVKAGVTHIMKRQQEGWAYIRP